LSDSLPSATIFNIMICKVPSVFSSVYSGTRSGCEPDGQIDLDLEILSIPIPM